MDGVVEAVFVGEEATGEGRYFARMLAAGVDQLAHVTAGAEGLGAVAAQHHAGDLRIGGPGVEALRQRVDHRQAEGVQALLGVQGGDADAETVQAGAFFEQYIHVGCLVLICCAVIYCAIGVRVFPGRR
ncbi:hypothetical protein D3C80_1576900 [compost metagenome]